MSARVVDMGILLTFEYVYENDGYSEIISDPQQTHSWKGDSRVC